MIKELALALEFDKAPKALQDIAKTHLENLKRYDKALAQVNAWSEEAGLANKEVNESGQTYQKLLKSWNPSPDDGQIEVKK